MVRVEWKRGPHSFSYVEGYGILGLVAPLVALVFPHAPALQAIWPGCHFQALTGYPCGTCGFTRAFVRGVRFELLDALHVSPLGTLLFYLWVFFGLVVVSTWLVPALTRPVLVPTGKALGRLLRFGIPVLFLLNWGYLCWVRWATGAPPA